MTTQTTTLAYNTTQEISCHSARQVPYLMLLQSTTPVYLAIYGCFSQRFLCHRSYACTCLNHELSGRIALRCDKYQFCDKMTVST